MLSLVPDSIEKYAQNHSREVEALFEELKNFTQENALMPQMQVGPIEGNFLKVLARITGAKRILEVGTFTGYSGLMMASGLPDDGELITCELDPDHAAIAQRFFDKSPWSAKIKLELGPAMDTIEKLRGPFDMAFIDADKVNYTNYFETIRPKMRPGGLMVVDNVLWSGRVLKSDRAKDASTQAIIAFNQHIQSLAELDHVLLTVRDGMMLIVT